MTMTVAAIITVLDLTPHPEGGFYLETFRDSGMVNGRSRSTCIYFLLPQGVISKWHRVDAVETWHWYGGAALDLRIAADATCYTAYTLGCALLAGERPQAVVPMGQWQQAQSRGVWTLVGCTVAPGFSFDGFEIAGPDFAPMPV